MNRMKTQFNMNLNWLRWKEANEDGRELTQDKKDLGHLFLKHGQRQGNQIFPRNNDDIDRGPDGTFQRPEHLANFSLGPVAHHRVADFLRGDDAEPLAPHLIGQKKHGADPVYSFFPAPVHDLLELGTLGQPFTLLKSEIAHRSNGQPFSPFTSSAGQYLATADGGVSFAKPVRPFPADVFRLIGSFHRPFRLARLD